MVHETVKARKRQGTKSMDLTIPVKLINELNINHGDIFEITSEGTEDKIILIYKRIYKNE